LEKNGVKKIYHAITMKFPGGNTSLGYIHDAIKNVLASAVKNKIKTIAIPGLGIGIGGLDFNSVAEIMIKAAQDYTDKIDIYFVDRNPIFISILKEKLRVEQ
jgi:O-acetyl-ADP-ribose deacetylase (regulator of RNase III)